MTAPTLLSSITSIERAMKLRKLAASSDVDTLIDNAATADLVPAICVLPNCDGTTEAEPDARANACPVCGAPSLVSCLVLAGLL